LWLTTNSIMHAFAKLFLWHTMCFFALNSEW
jgi:hypothetical protein